MSKVLSVLILQGDAEASLLADGALALQAMFADREIVVRREWMTRPDWFDAPVFAPHGMNPEVSIEEQSYNTVLQAGHQLVVFSLLPAVVLPGLVHGSGVQFLPHQTMMAGWPSTAVQSLPAQCQVIEPLSVSDAIELLEPKIVELMDAGIAVAVSNSFRHVSKPIELANLDTPTVRQRIRQLNLAVAQLSNRTGCFVLDIDRPLAQVGAAALQADCFGGNAKAAELALDEFAALAMDALPDQLMPLETA